MSEDPYAFDPFLKTYVTPVMHDAGFAKRGRRSWKIESSSHDLVTVAFGIYIATGLNFHIEWSVVPRAVREYISTLNGPANDRHEAVVSMRWYPPSVRRSNSMWSATYEAGVHRLGSNLQEELRNNALPFWLSMRDRSRVIEVLDAADEPGPPRAPLDHNHAPYAAVHLAPALLGMYEEDPHQMLALIGVAARYNNDPIIEWARDQLTARIATESSGNKTD